MKKLIIVIIPIVVFIGGYLIFYQNRPAEQKINPKTDQQTNSSQKWGAKTDEQANVTVVITPIDLSSKSTEWKFNVVMDTHSVELDQDMVKSVVLIDDQGNEYKSLKWDGTTGGHHREGMLIFSRITPTPKSIELKVSSIGDVVRNFVWEF